MRNSVLCGVSETQLNTILFQYRGTNLENISRFLISMLQTYREIPQKIGQHWNFQFYVSEAMNRDKYLRSGFIFSAKVAHMGLPSKYI